ncbi:hypothetical protein [Mycobacterium hubeiense]|uniref:hypothetical protein n=1 Tax=Mycobacterium hubeiense TaxID=1867256 RepID=UPI001158E7E1|nr:hypothetical protein [Mycobacterium sp. QGD 101]
MVSESPSHPSTIRFAMKMAVPAVVFNAVSGQHPRDVMAATQIGTSRAGGWTSSEARLDPSI